MIDPLIGKMFLVANDDPEIGDRIGEVINMMKPPSALFEPSLLRLIAKAWSRRLIRGRRPSMRRRRCRRWRWALKGRADRISVPGPPAAGRLTVARELQKLTGSLVRGRARGESYVAEVTYEGRFAYRCW